eukprot:Nk52_evm3s367 gene=Nk52_evmTU3s367
MSSGGGGDASTGGAGDPQAAAAGGGGGGGGGATPARIEFFLSDAQKGDVVSWLDEIKQFFAQSSVYDAPMDLHLETLDIIEGILLQYVVKLIPNLAHHLETVRMDSVVLLQKLAVVLSPQSAVNKSLEFKNIVTYFQHRDQVFQLIHRLFRLIGKHFTTMAVSLVAGLEAYIACDDSLVKEVALTVSSRLIFENQSVFIMQDRLSAVWNLFFMTGEDGRDHQMTSRVPLYEGLTLLAPTYTTEDPQLAAQIVSKLLQLKDKSREELVAIKATISEIFSHWAKNKKSAANTQKGYTVFRNLLTATEERNYDLLPWAVGEYTYKIHGITPGAIVKQNESLLNFLRSLESHVIAHPPLVRYGAALCIHASLAICPSLSQQYPYLLTEVIAGCLDHDLNTSFVYQSVLQMITSHNNEMPLAAGLLTQLKTQPFSHQLESDVIELREFLQHGKESMGLRDGKDKSEGGGGGGKDAGKQEEEDKGNGKGGGEGGKGSSKTKKDSTKNNNGGLSTAMSYLSLNRTKNVITLLDALQEVMIISPPLLEKVAERVICTLRYVKLTHQYKDLELLCLSTSRSRRNDPIILRTTCPLLESEDKKIQLFAIKIIGNLCRLLGSSGGGGGGAGKKINSADRDRDLIYCAAYYRKFMLSSNVAAHEDTTSLIYFLQNIPTFPYETMGIERIRDVLSCCVHLAFHSDPEVRRLTYEFLHKGACFRKTPDLQTETGVVLLLCLGDSMSANVETVLESIGGVLTSKTSAVLADFIMTMKEQILSQSASDQIEGFNAIVNYIINSKSSFPGLVQQFQNDRLIGNFWSLVGVSSSSSTAASVSSGAAGASGDSKMMTKGPADGDAAGSGLGAASGTQSVITGHNLYWFSLLCLKLQLKTNASEAEAVKSSEILFRLFEVAEKSKRTSAIITAVRCMFRDNKVDSLVLKDIIRAIGPKLSSQGSSHSIKLCCLMTIKLIVPMKLPGVNNYLIYNYLDRIVSLLDREPWSDIQMECLEILEVFLYCNPQATSRHMEQLRDLVREHSVNLDHGVAGIATRLYPLLHYVNSDRLDEQTFAFLKHDLNLITGSHWENDADPSWQKLSIADKHHLVCISIKCMGHLPKKFTKDIPECLIPVLAHPNAQIREACVEALLSIAPRAEIDERATMMWMILPLIGDANEETRGHFARLVQNTAHPFVHVEEILGRDPMDSGALKPDECGLGVIADGLMDVSLHPSLNTGSVCDIQLYYNLPAEKGYGVVPECMQALPTLEMSVFDVFHLLEEKLMLVKIPETDMQHKILYYMREYCNIPQLRGITMICMSKLAVRHTLEIMPTVIDLLLDGMLGDEHGQAREGELEKSKVFLNGCILGLKHVVSMHKKTFVNIFERLVSYDSEGETVIYCLYNMSEQIKQMCSESIPFLLDKYAKMATKFNLPKSTRVTIMDLLGELATVTSVHNLTGVIDAIERLLESKDPEIRKACERPLGKLISKVGMDHPLYETLLNQVKKFVYSYKTTNRMKSLKQYKYFGKALKKKDVYKFALIFLLDHRQDIVADCLQTLFDGSLSEFTLLFESWITQSGVKDSLNRLKAEQKQRSKVGDGEGNLPGEERGGGGVRESRPLEIDEGEEEEEEQAQEADEEFQEVEDFEVLRHEDNLVQGRRGLEIPLFDGDHANRKYYNSAQLYRYLEEYGIEKEDIFSSKVDETQRKNETFVIIQGQETVTSELEQDVELLSKMNLKPFLAYFLKEDPAVGEEILFETHQVLERASDDSLYGGLNLLESKPDLLNDGISKENIDQIFKEGAHCEQVYVKCLGVISLNRNIRMQISEFHSFIAVLFEKSGVIRESIFRRIEGSLRLYNEFVDIPITSQENYDEIQELFDTSKVNSFHMDRLKMNAMEHVENLAYLLRDITLLLIKGIESIGDFYREFDPGSDEDNNNLLVEGVKTILINHMFDNHKGVREKIIAVVLSVVQSKTKNVHFGRFINEELSQIAKTLFADKDLYRKKTDLLVLLTHGMSVIQDSEIKTEFIRKLLKLWDDPSFEVRAASIRMISLLGERKVPEIQEFLEEGTDKGQSVLMKEITKRQNDPSYQEKDSLNKLMVWLFDHRKDVKAKAAASTA